MSLLERRIQATYELAPKEAKKNVRVAIRWLKERLRDREGSGHSVHLSHHSKWDYDLKKVVETGLICCSFAKPEWSGDHCSRGMKTGAEAAVMAYCEYINGA